MLLKKLKTTATLDFYSADTSTELERPFIEHGITAGFPSPADEFFDASLDLNKVLIKNKEATFFGRVKGHSMQEDGIQDGDVVVIDRSLVPQNGSVVLCSVEEGFTLKRIRQEKDGLYLVPAHSAFPSIKITEASQFSIFGVITYVIHKVGRNQGAR